MIDIVHDYILMIGSQFIIGRGTTFTIHKESKSVSSRLCIHCNREYISTAISSIVSERTSFLEVILSAD
jgi:hypothetical protein